MGSIHCSCGKMFGVGEIPCPHEYILIADAALEELVENRLLPACAAVENREGMLYSALRAVSVSGYRCPHCGRMLIFWKGINGPAMIYHPEGT